jgi:hypothetical protein
VLTKKPCGNQSRCVVSRGEQGYRHPPSSIPMVEENDCISEKDDITPIPVLFLTSSTQPTAYSIFLQPYCHPRGWKEGLWTSLFL